MAQYVPKCETPCAPMQSQCKNAKKEVVVMGDLALDPPPTTTTSKQFDNLETFLVNFGVVVGGCLALDPPTTTPKPRLILYK